LTAGSQLGAYEILSAIGAGAMGEVYKARDIRLGRLVAVKILSPLVAGSPEARQRFEREARTISQLSHPHICAIYDIGHDGGTEFIVLELLEGETLADRIARGPLPVDQTVKYAAQIADALDKAHRRGIVHRDLKPANVMITRSGVKLLDFGLAKPAPFGTEAASAVTVAPSAPVTSGGMIAGTVQYMAPELLDGRPADARSDIFALGAVVYEMATGERLFRKVPRKLPVAWLDRIVRVAVADDPDERWQSAHDIALQLQALDAAVRDRDPKPARSGRRWWVIAATAAAIATAAVAWRTSRPSPAAAPIRFGLAPPPGQVFWDNLETVPLALAPDASRIGLIATDGRVQRVWIRAMDAMQAQPVNGSEGARSMFWSPDGRSIAFFANGKLKRVDLPSGAPITVCDVTDGIGLDGTWGSEDILFASVQGDAIYRVAATGGTPAVERKPDPARGERRTVYPWFMPDGRRYLFAARTVDDGGRVMIAEPGKDSRPLLDGVTNAQFMAPGYLVYARDGALFAQAFDGRRAQLAGAPVSIAERVRYFYSTGVARFGVSRSGSVAFHSHVDSERLAWLDRSGRDVGMVATGLFITLRLSPDGGRVAFSRAQPGIGTFDLWIADLARGNEQRLTSDPKSEVSPVWHPDGSAIFFSGGSGTQHVIRKSLATGEQTDLATGRGLQTAEDISRDGSTLFVTERGRNFDLWTMPLARPAERAPLVQTEFSEAQARLSPDSRFFAFTSNESGRNEIYVSSYPVRALKTPASTHGGTQPRWSRDGRELYFLSPDRHLMAVPVRTRPELALGAPAELFALPGRRIWKDYDVSVDESRFLAIVTGVLGDEQPLTVVLNWRPDGVQ
jgi:serine/threonine protein kinase/Tol biopolymer transport system component